MQALHDENTDALTTLTRREQEVLRRAALGDTNAQIAAGLGVSVHGVKFHLGAIFRKLGVPNRTSAAALYLASSRERD